jgi:hypothetical protein
MTVIAGCKTCTTTDNCNDEDVCTEDQCVDGVCGNIAKPTCCEPSTEKCTDGVDNDCDGVADCEDSNCSGSPSCLTEVCGNCVDDDEDGLMDFEDPDCCSQLHTFAMTLRRGRITPRGETSRLRLRTALAQSGMKGINPMKQDVFVQLRPEGGTNVFCAKIPAMKFMMKHKKFMFWDRKRRVASAKGLSDMTITVKRDGSVRLRTRGPHAQVKNLPAGRFQVTVGMHSDLLGDSENLCSTTTQAFRFNRRGRLLAP